MEILREGQEKAKEKAKEIEEKIEREVESKVLDKVFEEFEGKRRSTNESKNRLNAIITTYSYSQKLEKEVQKENLGREQFLKFEQLVKDLASSSQQ